MRTPPSRPRPQPAAVADKESRGGWRWSEGAAHAAAKHACTIDHVTAAELSATRFHSECASARLAHTLAPFLPASLPLSVLYTSSVQM